MLRRCTPVAGPLCALWLTVGASAFGDNWESGVDARAHTGRVEGGRGVGASDAASAPRFSTEVQLDVGLGPFRMVAADLNGDGNADLATGDFASATVSVLFGKGTGSFRKRIAYRTARRPSAITLADVEGDGNPDLVTASLDRAGSISVLLNRGSGRFRRGGTYRSGSKAYAVAAADINHDGIVDLVTGHDSRNHLTVLVGEPGGRFRLTHGYTGPGATDVTLGDLNGDGTLDVTLASFSGSIIVRPGLGDGTFGPAQAYKSGSEPFGVRMADLNHDDKLDIAVANYGGSSASVFLGIGDGTLGPRSRYRMGTRHGGNVDTVLVADFDRDGNPDIATPGYGSATVRRGRGDGTFGSPQKVLARRYRLFAQGGTVADFNGDGWPDLAVSESCDGADCYEFAPSSAYVFLNWTGRSAPPCVVPRIASYHVRLRVARRILRLAGCRLGHVRHRYSRRVSTGRVIGQRPRHHTVLPSHGRVDVVVGRGRGRRQ